MNNIMKKHTLLKECGYEYIFKQGLYYNPEDRVVIGERLVDARSMRELVDLVARKPDLVARKPLAAAFCGGWVFYLLDAHYSTELLEKLISIVEDHASGDAQCLDVTRRVERHFTTICHIDKAWVNVDEHGVPGGLGESDLAYHIFPKVYTIPYGDKYLWEWTTLAWGLIVANFREKPEGAKMNLAEIGERILYWRQKPLIERMPDGSKYIYARFGVLVLQEN